MGFISGTTTVSVQAHLTDIGKEKLYQSIQGDIQGGFITEFALGDSDCNYKTVDLYGTLESGNVPEASDYNPMLRSKALYTGDYIPGVPVLSVNEEYGFEVWQTMSIGANEQIYTLLNMKTEWPKNTIISEGYITSIVNPGNITDEALARLFFVTLLPNGQYAFQFNGSASDVELDVLLGPDRLSSTTIPIRFTGRKSNKSIMVMIELEQ